MKILFMVCLLMLAGCVSANYEVMPNEQMVVLKIIEIPGKKKDELFELSKIWITKNFKSAKAVVEYENKETGTIIGNGSFFRPSVSFHYSASDKVLFSMTEEIKEQKIRITFDKLAVTVQPFYSQFYSSPGGEGSMWLKEDFTNSTKVLLQLADDLGKYLLEAKPDKW